MKCGLENAKKHVYRGVESVLKRGNLLKKLEHQKKESVHLQMIPIDKWVQYYQNLLTKNRP